MLGHLDRIPYARPVIPAAARVGERPLKVTPSEPVPGPERQRRGIGHHVHPTVTVPHRGVTS